MEVDVISIKRYKRSYFALKEAEQEPNDEKGGMDYEIIQPGQNEPAHIKALESAPVLIKEGGGASQYAYSEFMDAELENEHTRKSYRHAIDRFLRHAKMQGVSLQTISPAMVGKYIRELRTTRGKEASKATRKVHLAAIRQLFDRLVMRHAVVLNPAASVKGPKLVSEGKTPAVSTEQARAVLNSIDTSNPVGLRDRAIIAVLIYTAARAGAVAKLKRKDLYSDGTQHLLRFDEKGGKVRDIPVRHDLEEYLREYLEASGVGQDQEDSGLFRTAYRKTKRLTDRQITGQDVLRMVKRRFKDAGLPERMLTAHTYRTTTITNLLEQGVPLEDVQYLAGHADPRTTRLYDRRGRKVTRNIVERISI